MQPEPGLNGRSRPPDLAAGAAEAAVDRMRAARETAKRKRAAARTAVKQLRERNREECRRLVDRARAAKQGHQNPWPDNRPPRPRELHLFDTDAEEAGVTPEPKPKEQPRRTTDDDWSQESWLH
jgi:hypothetical protein